MGGLVMNVLEKVREIKLVPVVVLNKVEETEPVIQALIDGDIPVAEICFRTDCAAECIKLAVEKFPNDLIGAGTVINATQCEQAIDCGAKFIVSPGFDAEIVAYCLEKDIPVCPGIQTPTELIQAVKMGLDHVKFFPAENAGGLGMINAVGAAFPKEKFMPTGGISPSNVVDYLKSSRIFCCGGSWLGKGDLIKSGDFATIKSLVAEAAAIVKANR